MLPERSESLLFLKKSTCYKIELVFLKPHEMELHYFLKSHLMFQWLRFSDLEISLIWLVSMSDHAKQVCESSDYNSYDDHPSAWVFSCHLLHIFRTSFPKNTSGRLFLDLALLFLSYNIYPIQVIQF